MLIIFHGVSIFELITREKKERKKKEKGRGESRWTESGQRESTGFEPLYTMFLMDLQFQNSDT